jgi:peptidoglycan hydrolase CwlO-like protein
MSARGVIPLTHGQAQQTLHTQSLELAYEKTLRGFDLAVEEEKARRLRLGILLLEDENDDLHAQLAQDDDRIDHLEEDAQALQSQLDTMEGETERLRAELRMKSREVEKLKVCIVGNPVAHIR